MPDLSLKDLLDFETLPEEVQEIAFRYFAFHTEERVGYEEGRADGYQLGYEHGLNQRRRRKAHGKND
jgi:flagellar biosynthesis/type III secretory pathway protein FliH